jgi:hypothetical protein
MVTQAGEWVLLAYRIPREPSTPRIAVWRKLRQLGVGQLGDGLVALPLDARNRESLEWIADEVLEAGGLASVWLARPTTAAQEQELIDQMTEAVSAEYQAIIDAAREAAGTPDGRQRRTVGRLRREAQRVRDRDYFAAPEGDHVRAALDELARAIEQAAAR